MENKFDIVEFKNLIINIQDNYRALRVDRTNQEIYEKQKKLLKELEYLLNNNLLPSDLFSKTTNFYFRYYRATEGTYIPLKKHKNK